MFLAVCLCQFCTIVILIEAGEARSSSLVSTQATGLEFVREWYEMVIDITSNLPFSSPFCRHPCCCGSYCPEPCDTPRQCHSSRCCSHGGSCQRRGHSSEHDSDTLYTVKTSPSRMIPCHVGDPRRSSPLSLDSCPPCHSNHCS